MVPRSPLSSGSPPHHRRHSRGRPRQKVRKRQARNRCVCVRLCHTHTHVHTRTCIHTDTDTHTDTHTQKRFGHVTGIDPTIERKHHSIATYGRKMRHGTACEWKNGTRDVVRVRSERMHDEKDMTWKKWWWMHECRQHGWTWRTTVSAREGWWEAVERAISLVSRRRVSSAHAIQGRRTSYESTVFPRGSIHRTRGRRRPSCPYGTRILGFLPSVVHVRVPLLRSAV